MDKVKDDTLLKFAKTGLKCTRCKLQQGTQQIVFGDGNPKAQLVFVGEGPGADEDMQGLPFVGRAGKLLTQMIEAMGCSARSLHLQCGEVRPPENARRSPTRLRPARRF